MVEHIGYLSDRLHPGVSALAVAHRHLVDRCSASDDVGDWRERAVLGPLADVADYVKRIGDHPELVHYRAEKAGALLHAAVRLQREALLAYAGWPEGGDEERRIIEAADLLEAVARELQADMWLAARRARGDSAAFYRYRANELAAVVNRFTRWASGLMSSAVPDPVED